MVHVLSLVLFVQKFGAGKRAFCSKPSRQGASCWLLGPYMPALLPPLLKTCSLFTLYPCVCSGRPMALVHYQHKHHDVIRLHVPMLHPNPPAAIASDIAPSSQRCHCAWHAHMRARAKHRRRLWARAQARTDQCTPAAAGRPCF